MPRPTSPPTNTPSRAPRARLSAAALIAAVALACGGSPSGGAPDGAGPLPDGAAPGEDGGFAPDAPGPTEDGGAPGSDGGLVPEGQAPEPRPGERRVPGSLHPLGTPLVAAVALPEGASPDAPVPACLVVHGSGGLFRDGPAAGAPCAAEVQGVYRELMDLLAAEGVAAVAPSSFYSRDERFCDDRDFLDYAPPPFFPAGTASERKERDDGYKIRRHSVRALDLLAAARAAAAMPEVDGTRLCMIGTSNGGSAILGYAAQDLERHLVEFLTLAPRDYENAANQDFEERSAALASFPPPPADLAAQLAARPLPRFAQPVAPGCTLRELIPDVEPDEALRDSDLYYPAGDVALHLELGLRDSVVERCAVAVGDGLRERQARAYEDRAGVDPSRYLVHTHDGEHDLLQDAVTGPAIRARLVELVGRHLLP